VSGAQLLANFAGEEGEDWRAREDSQLPLAKLWGLLFGPQTRLIDRAGQGG